MNVSVTERGWTHSRYWQDTDHAMRRKVNALVKECQRRPLEGAGKPDPLKGDLSGLWSRRINRVIGWSIGSRIAQWKPSSAAITPVI